MHKHSFPLVVLLALSFFGPGCALYRYSTDGVRVRTVAGARPVLVEPLDARPDVASGGGEIGEVREAVVEHFDRAAVSGRVVAAPASPEALAAVLAEADAAGEREVIFVRWQGALSTGRNYTMAVGGTALLGLVPWLVLTSVPINHHGGVAAFELVVVEPSSGEILVRVSEVGGFAEDVSTWGYDPNGIMREMMRTTVETLIDRYLAAREAGYPDRRRAADLATLILSPRVGAEDGVLSGLGFRMNVPTETAWESVVGEVAHLSLPGSVHLSVQRYVMDDPAGLDDFVRHELDAVGTIDVVQSLGTGASTRTAFRGNTDVGGIFVAHTFAMAGAGYRFTCWIPSDAPTTSSEACVASLRSIAIDGVTRGGVRMASHP
jgi:hypothetical protein